MLMLVISVLLKMAQTWPWSGKLQSGHVLHSDVLLSIPRVLICFLATCCYKKTIARGRRRHATLSLLSKRHSHHHHHQQHHYQRTFIIPLAYERTDDLW
uniref:Putative secreted protein n=1 Tax=Anopheles aquasalis TaxID=42839 RepID=T1E8V9_ANOAQ